MAAKIITYFCLFSAQFCFIVILSVIVLRQKTLAHYLLAGQLVCSVILAMFSWLVMSPEYYDFRYSFFLHVPAGFFIGPFTLTYVYSVTRENYALKKTQLLYYVLPMLSLILIPIWFIASDFPPVSNIVTYYSGTSLSTLDIITSFAFFLNFIYYVLIIKNLIVFFKPKNFDNSTTILVLFCFLLIVMISALSLSSIIFREIQLMGLSGASLFIVVTAIVLAIQRNPALVEGLRDIIAEDKANLSNLQGVDLSLVAHDLERLLKEEKVYQNGDLSLGSLGKQLGLNRNQLSAYINQTYQKNFKSFLNDRRILEAKKLLKTDLETPIIRIALKVGFNSKSTFNHTFQKIVGLTPSEYRTNSILKQAGIK